MTSSSTRQRREGREDRRQRARVVVRAPLSRCGEGAIARNEVPRRARHATTTTTTRESVRACAMSRRRVPPSRWYTSRVYRATSQRCRAEAGRSACTRVQRCAVATYAATVCQASCMRHERALTTPRARWKGGPPCAQLRTAARDGVRVPMRHYDKRSQLRSGPAPAVRRRCGAERCCVGSVVDRSSSSIDRSRGQQSTD